MEMLSWAMAAAGVAGTAALGFIVVRLLTVLLEWNSRLLVVITVNQSFKPSIYDEINQWRVSKITGGNSTSEDWQVLDRLRSVVNSKGYLRFELTNTSRKTLSNVTFSSSYGELVQVNNGALEQADKDTPIVVGDLQPGRTTVIHLLTSSTFALDSLHSIRSHFNLSANELGRVAYRYPVPAHIKKRRSDRITLFMLVIAIICALAATLGIPLARQLGFVP